MPKVEVFEGEADDLFFEADFECPPRIGEYISRDAEGYFKYYYVVEAWHRGTGAGPFTYCVRVELKD